jgi:sulfate permease, SulP family
VNARGAEDFHTLPSDHGLEAAPGVVVYRFDAPLFFANADYFVKHAIRLFDEAQPRLLVLDFEAVTFIDVTAARALTRLLEHVTAGHAELRLARTRQAVVEQLTDAGLVSAIGKQRFYPSVRTAVERPRVRAKPTTAGK